MQNFLAAVILFLGVSTGVGQNYHAFPVGEFWQFGNARMLGLAGAGSVSNAGPSALMFNPATLAKNPHFLVAGISSGFRKLDERRSYPIYNRIDDIVQTGTYAANNHWFAQFQGGVIWGIPSGKIPFLKSIAMGAYQEIDLDYRYREEVRENIFGDSLLAFNEIELSGNLMRYAAGAGFSLFNNLHLGLQVGLLQGDLQDLQKITFYKRGFSDRLTRANYNLRNLPLVTSLGGLYEVNPWITLGNSIRFPVTVEYDLATTDEHTLAGQHTETIEYPLILNAGFEYRARQELQARLNIDFYYEWWSKTDKPVVLPASGSNQVFEDAFSVRVGIEHIFFNQVPFRVGIQYRTMPQDRSIARTLLTAGTGLQNSWWKIDLSGGFGKYEYKNPDLFDDALYGNYYRNSPLDDVEENHFFGLATFSIFMK